MKNTSIRRANSGQPVSHKHPLTNSFIILEVFCIFQPCAVPKIREKNNKINLDKVNKIFKRNIDPKKVSQWNMVGKNTIIPQISSVKRRQGIYFYKYSDTKLRTCNKSQLLQKPQTSKSSNPIKHQLTKTEKNISANYKKNLKKRKPL